MVVIVSSETDCLECFTSVPTPAELFRCHLINTIKETNPLKDFQLYDEDLDFIISQDFNEDDCSSNQNMDVYLTYLTDRSNS